MGEFLEKVEVEGSEGNVSRVLVYDYAVGGDGVEGVETQVKEGFLGEGGVGHKPEWAQWGEGDSLFGEFVKCIQEEMRD